jgi:hypothetical protein
MKSEEPRPAFMLNRCRTYAERSTVTTAVLSPIRAADRCDRCGAQAYIRAVLANGSELLFCGHHGRHHEPKLRPLTVEWHDTTEQLAAATPATAPDGER